MKTWVDYEREDVAAEKARIQAEAATQLEIERLTVLNAELGAALDGLLKAMAPYMQDNDIHRPREQDLAWARAGAAIVAREDRRAYFGSVL